MIAVLWHLHQPEYRDPQTGVPSMPWTRLHALRGYRDLVEECVADDLPVTLNLVPGLWSQLRTVANRVQDPHWALTLRDADTLSAEEQARVRETFPCGHPAMSNVSAHYAQLRSRAEAGEALTVPELHDLQVWSTLAWFGATALRDFPVLGELRAKGQGFSRSDKHDMVAVMDAIVAEIPHWLTRLGALSRTAVSTTPLHHPILPLLIDASCARRAMPDLPDEVDFRHPQDALAQLVRGRQALAELGEGGPVGLWPSEGSVSPELIPLAAEAGFRWLCTDEEVLAKSEVDGGPGLGPWDLGHGVRGFFRNRALSDRIGFQYATWEASEAVADLVARATEPLTVLALDGENPWESFADAGAAFRTGLNRVLATQGVSLDDAAKRAPVGQVQRLHTGSWIHANFQIWIGDAQDRAAWKLLSAVRAVVEAHEGPVDVALEHIYAAEGSDWFWWYGPEFSTPFDGAFDQQFRDHIAAAWRAIGREPPAEVFRPIGQEPATLPRATELAGPAWQRLRPIASTTMAASGAPVWDLRVGAAAVGKLWLAGRCLAHAVLTIDGDAEAVVRRHAGAFWVCVPSGATLVAEADGAQWRSAPVETHAAAPDWGL